MNELGNITISPNVVKDIVVEVITGIENVVGVSTPEVRAKLSNLFKSDEKKSLEVEMGETECVIELSISVVYGCKIREVAAEVQKAVKEKVEEMTGVTVREINIIVDKVVKEDEVENV